jgi:hypothetical protein
VLGYPTGPGGPDVEGAMTTLVTGHATIGELEVDIQDDVNTTPIKTVGVTGHAKVGKMKYTMKEYEPGTVSIGPGASKEDQKTAADLQDFLNNLSRPDPTGNKPSMKQMRSRIVIASKNSNISGNLKVSVAGTVENTDITVLSDHARVGGDVAVDIGSSSNKK